jgi:hypothetical protein
MGKRKNLATRKPGGALRDQPQLPSPSETKRLFDLVLAGVRPPEFGTQLGRLMASGRITPAQFNAGNAWCVLVQAYAIACRGPKQPGSIEMDAAGGTASDVDSDIGIKEAGRDRRVVETYLAATQLLKLAPARSLKTLEAVVVRDEYYGTHDDLVALKAALDILSAFYSSKREKPKTQQQRRVSDGC